VDEQAPVRDAATVVLLRDTPGGPEAYLQRRVTGMAFAGGVHVFPGGAADPVDTDLLDTAVREVAEETGVVLGRSDVHPWARWVTPEGEPRRYDTRFYVAALPRGAEPVGLGTEMDTTGWWSPAGALEAFERGEIVLWPPTFVTLAEIGGHADVAAVLAASTGRDLEPVRPVLVRDPDGYRVVLPDGRELSR
jgi:8-oxo-dGTP pyrophosphatase MutT (NUDIX family)